MPIARAGSLCFNRAMQAPTVEERTESGKSRRKKVTREALAASKPRGRQFELLDLLRASERNRMPDLLPMKYGRMSESPFAFFRGSIALMAVDLGRSANTGIDVQLCGDAHVRNLGSFAAPDGELVFGINDFDETIRGPWEWDVKRMATSLILGSNEAGHRPNIALAAVECFVQSYCEALAEFARQPILHVARHQIRGEHRAVAVQNAFQESKRVSPRDLLKSLTNKDRKGARQFRDAPPRTRRITANTAKEVIASLQMYRQSLAPERRHLFDLFRTVDVGFRVVGTGSVGLRSYVVLLEGNGAEDPLFLQVKQEVASAYATGKPGNRHQGQRVVDGCRAMQPIADPLLGWTTIGKDQFLVRQLNDRKGSVDLSVLNGQGLKSFAAVAGEIVARGHARSGDACEISGYCGSGDKMARILTAFARDYADQVAADHNQFLAAIHAGKIKADPPPTTA